MSPSSLREAMISDFLRRFKEIAAINQIYFVPREKNRQGLAILGLTYEGAAEIIHALTPREHLRGPEPDRNRRFPGKVCTFQVAYNGTAVHIKLRLSGNHPFCISFHPTDFPDAT